MLTLLDEPHQYPLALQRTGDSGFRTQPIGQSACRCMMSDSCFWPCWPAACEDTPHGAETVQHQGKVLAMPSQQAVRWQTLRKPSG